MRLLRVTLPVAVAMAFGLAMWAQYFIPAQLSQDALETYTASWSVIIAAAALILGTISAVLHHLEKVTKKRAGYGYSIITLACFTITAWFGLIPIRYPGFTGVGRADNSVFMWIFSYVFNPLDATVFALLAFYIASAAFRAFRARSFEATMLLVAGILVMLGRIPLGAYLNFGPGLGLEELAGWILNVPNAGMQSAIVLGVTLSQVAIAIRIIFGIERTYLGGGK